MCLIFVAHRLREDYPLVVAANRDEFHTREALPAAFWADAPDVLAGRDAQAGGTWLGIDVRGRFCAITNHRGHAPSPGAPSRGELVSGFLRRCTPPLTYVREVDGKGASYNGFSLLAGTRDALAWTSNNGPGPCALGPGLYGLSNALLDTPWPKLTRGKAGISKALAARRVEVRALLDVLADRAAPARDDLPDTGVGADTERMLAPIFIRADTYGTRCSTVIVMHRSGQTLFVERSFDANGRETGTVEHEVQVRSSAASA